MVEFNQQYGQQAALPDPFDVINGVGGIPQLPFNLKDQYGQNQSAAVGTSFVGRLDRNLETRQAIDYTSKEPKFYQDGNPILNVVATMDTIQPALAGSGGPDDDGKRRFYFGGQSLRALQDAVKDKGGTMIGTGSVLQITLTELKPSGKGNPQKIYSVVIHEAIERTNAQQQQAMQAVGATQGQPQFTGQPQYAQPLTTPQGQPAAVPQYQVPQVPQQVQYQQPQAPAYVAPQVASAPAPQMPEAASAAPAIDVNALVAKVNALTGVGLPPETAIAAVVNTEAGGDQAVYAALATAVGAAAQ